MPPTPRPQNTVPRLESQRLQCPPVRRDRCTHGLNREWLRAMMRYYAVGDKPRITSWVRATTVAQETKATAIVERCPDGTNTRWKRHQGIWKDPTAALPTAPNRPPYCPIV